MASVYLKVVLAAFAVVIVAAGVLFYLNRPQAAPLTSPYANLEQSSSTAPANPTPSSPQTVSISGMSKYTDANFGFSFWYPNNLKVTTSEPSQKAQASATDDYGAETKIVKTVSSPEFFIYEVYSPLMSIYAYSIDDPSGESFYENYFFDTNRYVWMVAESNIPNGSPDATTTADVSKNTMGGLHMLGAYTKGSIKVIIPLSTHNFLVLYSGCNDFMDYTCDSGTNGGGEDKFNKLVQTIAATDPSVATPVSSAEQIKAIQAEKDAYAGH